jgi:hypothetical protein
MITISHGTTCAGQNDPTKQVSKDGWNANHPVTMATGVVGRVAAGTGPASELTGAEVLAFAGAAASVHGHDASVITTGTLETARLGSGTANNTTFLRGDQTWVAPAAGGSPFMFEGSLAADASTGANVTPISLTGLVFTFEANSRYWIEFQGATRAAAATTGSGFQLDLSVAVTRVGLGFTHVLANTGTVTAGSSIADDASAGVSSGRATINVDTPTFGGGYLITGANAGTAQLRYRSEVAAVSTVMAGFMMRVRKLP